MIKLRPPRTLLSYSRRELEVGVGGSLAAESSIMGVGGLGSARARREAPSRQTTGTTPLLGHQETEKQKCPLYTTPPTHTHAHTHGDRRDGGCPSLAPQPSPGLPAPRLPRGARAGVRGDVSPRGGLSLEAAEAPSSGGDAWEGARTPVLSCR